MHWAYNNLLNLQEYPTLFCRYNIFADLCTVYTFNFEVKLYKYVVLSGKCVDKYFKSMGDFTWRPLQPESMGTNNGTHMVHTKPSWLS